MKLLKEGLSRKLVELVQSQNFKCALTGRSLTPEIAALDHCQPVSRGGAIADIANLQVIHNDVNAAKGVMTNSEFVTMCREVVDFHDKKRTE